MVKPCRKQLSGATNRKKAKAKAIEIANVMSIVSSIHVCLIKAYFKAKNVNDTEKYADMLHYYTPCNKYLFKQ